MRTSLNNIARLLDSFDDKTSIEQDFLEDLKRSIELTDAKNQKVPSKTYKPSSMKCVRQMYYQVSGVEPDESSTSYCLIGICNSGTDTHVRIQQAVENMRNNSMNCEYIDVAKFVENRHLDSLEIKEHNASGTETKLYHKELNISFMCDGIIKYKNHYYILELKTESSYKWTQRKGVNPEHYEQGIAYSIMLNLPEVMFIYINRDNLDMKSYLFRPTDEQKEELIGKITLCDEYVKNKLVPDKPQDIGRVCTYCQYKKTCSKD